MSENEIAKIWHPVVDVYKYDDEQTEWVAKKSGILAPQHQQFIDLGVEPYEITHSEGNLLTTAGLTRLAAKLIENVNAGSGDLQGLSNTATRLGVSNGSTAETVGDTTLSGASKWFQVMDATFPSVSGAVLTAKATFATGDGNFAWLDWGLDVGTPTVTSGATVNALLFNRKVASLGTKASGSWALTVTVTFA